MRVDRQCLTLILQEEEEICKPEPISVQVPDPVP